MSKAPTPAKVTTVNVSPIDQLILALTALVSDKDAALNIKHLFVNQRENGDLQVSLDMHVPN